MLQECIDILYGAKKENLQKEIIDNYIPKNGLYLIFKRTEQGYAQQGEPLRIHWDKKNNKLIGEEDTRYRKICTWDYYSNLIDMNKPIDKKKVIHSNNYLTFFIKQESLLEHKLTNQIIEEYYKVLANPYLKYSSGKSKEAYQVLEEQIGQVNADQIGSIKEFMLGILPEIVSILDNPKEYLKIFIDADDFEYERESNRYLLPNIYNSTEYNIKCDDKILGLPNDNMGLNSKKPYLKNHSRKVSVPYLLDNETVLKQKRLFDYLSNAAAKNRVNIFFTYKPQSQRKYEVIELTNDEMLEQDFSGIFLRIRLSKVLEIVSTDVISQYSPKLSKPFQLANVIQMDLLKSENELEYYGVPIKAKKMMRNLLNEILFYKFLTLNFFTKPEELQLKEVIVRNCLLESREAIFAWLYKDECVQINSLLQRVCSRLIQNSISNGYMKKASHQFNLKCSLREYFNEEEPSMADTVENIREKLISKITNKGFQTFESDEEYYYAVGQVVNYFISLNKSKKKTHSLANPFFNTKSDKVLKDKLRGLFLKYNYDIQTFSVRFNQLYGMIEAYQPMKENLVDFMIAGYLQSNILYLKNED